MSINLMDLVKDQLTDGIMDKLSSAIGENTSATSSAVSHFLPALMGGIIDKGSSQSGASSIMKLITDNALGGDTLSNLGSLLGGGDKTSTFMKLGGTLLSGLLGSRQDSMLSNLLSLTGLGRKSGSSLLSFLAPIVLGQLGKLISRDNMDAGGVQRLLSSQKSYLANSAVSGASHSSSSSDGGGMGWLKWLLPLLLIGALLWYFMGCGGDKSVAADADKVEESATTSSNDTHGHTHTGDSHDGHSHDHSHDGHSHDHAHDHSGSTTSSTTGTTTNAGTDELVTLSIDADGNLVSSTGEIVAKAGEFKEVDGKYLDKDGNEISLLKKIGNAVGGAAKATAGAVGDAAGATKDAFVNLFGGLFSKKEKIGSTYSLTQIEFNDENHRITNFSKAEVEGLAAALKAYPDAKIQVQVHSNDGDKITGERAKVVRDMLVTLGVAKDQISAKGMGDGDAAKASAEKVEIMVEQTVK